MASALSSNTNDHIAGAKTAFNYRRELNPSLLEIALLSRGIPAPAPEGDYTYIEIECGQGLSTLIHAAGYPGARFYASDADSHSVATARKFAEAAGLDNLSLLEVNLAGLADADLPMFDVIAMHGVWSRVSDENRSHIVRFLDRRLKSGGIAYIAYDALPGYAHLLPLRELLRSGDPESGSLAKAEMGIALAERIRDSHVGYFRSNPDAVAFLSEIKAKSRACLADECHSSRWAPIYHSEIVDALQPIGLNFGGSARIIDNFDVFNFSAEAREIIDTVQSSKDRETLKDFFVNRMFRRDIFVRGSASKSQDAIAQFAAKPFAARISPDFLPEASVRTGLGEFKPRPEFAGPILEILSNAPASAANLIQRPTCGHISPSVMLETLIVLAAAWALDPAPPGMEPERFRRVRLLNSALWERALAADEIHAAAAPATGGGVEGLSRAEQIALLARERGVNEMDLLVEVIGKDQAEPHAALLARRLDALKVLGIGG